MRAAPVRTGRGPTNRRQDTHMSNLGHKLKHLVHELIPVVGFFFVTFQLLALTEALMLKQYGISVSAFLTATVMALVVGKVVLIADHFPLVNRFPTKPLSYNVLWKTPSTSPPWSLSVTRSTSFTSGARRGTQPR